MRLLYGLDQLPASVAVDDERLPSMVLGVAPLRLNSEPVPQAFFPTGEDQSTRLAAVSAWLEAACGPYAPYRRRFVALYLAFAVTHVQRNRDELSERLRRFEGLYHAEDWVWSALRPVPRAWVPAGDTRLLTDIAFWDGEQLTAVMIGEERLGHDRMLRASGFAVCRIAGMSLAREPEAMVREYLPASLRRFWEGEILPMSPFRRRWAGDPDGGRAPA